MCGRWVNFHGDAVIRFTDNLAGKLKSPLRLFRKETKNVPSPRHYLPFEELYLK